LIGYDGAKVWDLKTGYELSIPPKFSKSAVTAVRWARSASSDPYDRLVVGTATGQMMLWTSKKKVRVSSDLELNLEC
jgi:WD40 repeat protein